MKGLSDFSKYRHCKRCLKELPNLHENSPDVTSTPLAEQIEKTIETTADSLCASCQALTQLQENWKPFPLGASIGGIFFVPDKEPSKKE